MVRVIVGDLFASQAQALVNTVNCVGVMGKGVALEFKKRFPAMYEDYVARCDYGEVRLGEPYLYRPATLPWVLNFPTKDHWRSVTKLADIERGLRYLIEHYEAWEITSLAVPPLGCGNGQLEWRIVGPTLYRYLQEITIPVELYAPYGTPHEELSPGFLHHASVTAVAASMPEPEWVPAEWIVLAEILKRILDEPFHHPIGRTTFQKIAYVSTKQGLPTGIEFSRGSFGPFASNLKAIEARLINNGLVRVSNGSKMHRFTIGSTFAAARKAYSPAIDQWEALIERTVDLFLRFDTTGAEIAASSLFVAGEFAEQGETPTERMIFDAVIEWKKRRREPLHEDMVAEMIRTLADRAWLEVQKSDDLPLPHHELLYA